MSKEEKNSKIEEEPTPVPAEEKKFKKKRKGKNSQKKATESYRLRRSTQECEEFDRYLIEKYDLYNLDRGGRVDQTVKSLVTTPSKCAVPLSVTTRGVGFAVSAIYQQAGTTWTPQQMWEIATVYQIYRVSLFLMDYTVYLAQQVQTEPINKARPFEQVHIDGAVANELATIQQVPSSVALVLSTTGKLINESTIFHVGYATEDQFDSPAEFRTMVIRPDNIRGLLEDASDPTNESLVEELRAFNSIPGLQFSNRAVVNANVVWPERYGINDLKTDINAFKAWV